MAKTLQVIAAALLLVAIRGAAAAPPSPNEAQAQGQTTPLGASSAPHQPIAPPAASVRGPRFGQIEVNGVSALSNDDVEAVLEVRPGDPVDRKAVERSLEALVQLYQMRGFEAADAGAVMKNGVLEINVKEGEPTRISDIRFEVDGIQGPAFARYWDRLKATLPSRFGVAAGDLYDQEKVSSGRRALQDALAVEEFVGAKVNFVRVETAEAPTAAQLGEEVSKKLGDHPARRWVTLEVHLDLGDRVTFGFRGNQVFSQTQLNALVEEQRLLGFGKDYLNSIRDRILAEYQASGYPETKITTYTFEREGLSFGDRSRARHVTFDIQEGPRVRIDAVHFDGNHVFPESELRSEFFDRASSTVQSRYYVAKDVESAANALIDWIKSKGYLGAKLVTTDTAYLPPASGRPERGAVQLTIFVFEGDQTLVRDIAISGAKAIDPAEVKTTLEIEEGRPFNTYAFSEGLETLKSKYHELGYLDAKIVNEGHDDVVRYAQDNRVASIKLDIDEGPISRVSRIEVEGLDHTRERVVRRKLEFEEGDVLREIVLNDSEKNLRRIGLFSSASIRVVDDPDKPAGSGLKIVRVSVKEGTPGLLGGGIGFRNDLGVRAFGQAGYDNLWWDNHSIALTLNANRRVEDFHFLEYQAQVSYLWPWFVFKDLTFRPAVTVTTQQYINFNADTRALTLTWERRLLSHPQITAVFTYSLERIRQYGANANPIDVGDFIIGSVTPALRFDTRDDPLAPTTGWFSSLSYEIASPNLFSRTYSDLGVYPLGFTRAQFRLDRHFTFFDKIGLYLTSRMGAARNTVEPARNPVTGEADPRTGTIPLIKQFSLGGVGSLRGFHDQELNFFGTAIQGTETYVNYRAQFDLPFMGALRFGPFLDAGNLQVDTFSFGNLRYGAGAGFHYLTPVGPVNLDWGFNLAPKPGETTNEVYFSIGII